MTTHSLDHVSLSLLGWVRVLETPLRGLTSGDCVVVLTTIVNHAVLETSSMPRDIIKMICVQCTGGGF